VLFDVVQEMKRSEIHPSDWWAARRFQYNLALVVAGVVAFIAYVVVGSTLLPSYALFEVTIFTTLFQGIGYLFMTGVANVIYFIGPISESIVSPANPGRYRQVCYQLGLWFSIILPLSIPVLLAVLSLFYPDYFRSIELEP
jgi:hypothetical protein